MLFVRCYLCTYLNFSFTEKTNGDRVPGLAHAPPGETQGAGLGLAHAPPGETPGGGGLTLGLAHAPPGETPGGVLDHVGATTDRGADQGRGDTNKGKILYTFLIIV